MNRRSRTWRGGTGTREGTAAVDWKRAGLGAGRVVAGTWSRDCLMRDAMKLADYLHKEDVLPDLAATVRDEALDEFAALLASRHPDLTRAEILRVLTERELLGSTGIGDGVAIPHGKLSTSEACILLFARSRAGVSYGALDGKPVQLFFVLLAPQSAAGMHLKVLARISRILKDPAVRHELLVAPDAASLYTTIMKQDTRY